MYIYIYINLQGCLLNVIMHAIERIKKEKKKNYIFHYSQSSTIL